MSEQLVLLHLISDNPYQPRVTDDPEHIEKLARSIVADGLLQTPKARACTDGTYQLAFGHSRRKAFEWLVEQGSQLDGWVDRYMSYTGMPLEVVELTDEEMYRHAVTENVQRKDLNPIELSTAMKRYRDEFKKTSDEIGELFGVNGATVRGLIRLLDLPETVRTRVESGEITQGAARKLLTVSRNIQAEQLTEIVEDIVSGEDPDDVIEMSIRNNEITVDMWRSWRSGKPLAGDGLWQIDLPAEKFPLKHLPEVTVAKAAEIVGGDWSSHHDKGVLLGRIYHFQDGGSIDTMPGYQTMVDVQGEAVVNESYERLAHLINPPSCKDCPFHIIVDRSHYCSFKPCHQRKAKAWVAADMQKISKKLGIAVYDPEIDGKTTLALCESTYQDEYKIHAKLVENKDPGLRIAPHNSQYDAHKWTESMRARLVLVGDRAKAIKEKQRETSAKAKEKADNSYEAQRRQWQIQNENRDASDRFIRDYASAFFADAFKKLDHIPAMSTLVGVEIKNTVKKADALTTLRRELAIDTLERGKVDYSLKSKGPEKTAKYLQGVATTWGIKLPADFLTVAKTYEIPVSTETEQKKK